MSARSIQMNHIIIYSQAEFCVQYSTMPTHGDLCTSEMLAFLDVEQIFNRPLKCPVPFCGSELTPIEMLTHLLMGHSPGESMLETVANCPELFHVQLNELKAGTSYVIAAIAYHGTPKVGLSTPVSPELQIVHQLPVMLVMYVTPLANKHNGIDTDNAEQTVIFYMVSPLMATEVGVQITLLDGDQDMPGQKALCQFSAHTQTGAYGLGFGEVEQLLVHMEFVFYSASSIQKLIDADPERQLHVKVVLTGEPNSLGSESHPEYPE
ncbi:uncharacterized protein [Drosophila pseudoobscura]|uniref:DUF4729 domain-containing protein n=1 Tax=Drosophila pseudoobscura pseudoobscura TaxID=46245 RepID=A0A6I8VVZ7_DROPS|nr:uncharacterized protein LOC4816456 [Drosophila pseudoobscura]XP_033235251.1 uncharacterized protein LOC117183909 [Drosophila pseudoobscura]